MKQEILERLHRSQIEILDIVHEFCVKNRLKYYLFAGTLLGAVRHKGFIPWDDDIDICMPRTDYEYLLKNISKFLGNKYFLQTCNTDKFYGRHFAKIRINNTIFLEQVDCTVEKRHHGIFLDIFPLDDCSPKLFKKRKFKRKLWSLIDSYIVCKRSNIKLKGYKRFLIIFPIKFLIKMRDRLIKGKGDGYFLSCGLIPKNKFDDAILLPFEGKEYYGPIDYDFVLTSQYGDYMIMPPEDKRVTHNPVRLSFDLNGPDVEL